MTNDNEFAGDKKASTSLLTRLETDFKLWAIPKIPSYIETYHLTYLTLVWSIGVAILGVLAGENLAYLWGISLLIFLQYLSDLFDGELGRQRDTGLIKWGFYMDHFLDYIFLCSLVFAGYMISPFGLEVWYFGLVVILGSFMVNSFLSFAATNQFEIAYYGIGPTEMRVIFILINTYIIYAGTGQFWILLPVLVSVCLAALAFNSYQIQKNLWALDMEHKKKGP